VNLAKPAGNASSKGKQAQQDKLKQEGKN